VREPGKPNLLREIYLDNHATTRVDPRVVEAMLPWMVSEFANPGSLTHEPGRRVAAKVDACRDRIAELLNARSADVVFTSGATESINLAIFGIAFHPKQKRRRIVSAATEHRAVLDPLQRLEKLGWEIVYLPIEQDDPQRIGQVNLESAQGVIDENTALVCLMLGNNEIGTIQPFHELSCMCRSRGAILHLDACQAVGKIPVDFDSLDADLLSFSSHKFHGPKGMGGLLVRQDFATRKIQAQIVGGGQQNNLRSGTLNSVGIVGMTTALELAIQEMDAESVRLAELRESLWTHLESAIDGLLLNGPIWPSDSTSLQRLPGNLNVCFPRVEGQSLMLRTPLLAVSSGSACTSEEPHPSHVLRAIGRTEDQARSSLRFGIGRFNTLEEIVQASTWLIDAYRDLVALIA
jgi:cysteine desulfurase